MKGKKKLSQDTAPHPGMSQGMDTVPKSNFTSRNLGTGRPPSSAQHVVSTHTGERTAHMIIFAQRVIIMIMPHTCVEPHARALQSAFTVATLATGQVIAPETHGTRENCMQHLTL